MKIFEKIIAFSSLFGNILELLYSKAIEAPLQKVTFWLRIVSFTSIRYPMYPLNSATLPQIKKKTQRKDEN